MPEQPRQDSQIDLSVIVPVYDNAATLEALIDRTIAVLEPLGLAFEIVLVDDGSRDASLSLLRERARRDARVRPFALARNFGSQAAACAALDQVRGRRVVSLDADLENLPEDIPALLEPLGRGYDLVCGYRRERRAAWLTRRLPSWLMNAWIRHRTGTTVPDLGCGMRAMEASLVRNLGAEGEARRMLTPLILRRARRVAIVAVRAGAESRSSRHSFLTLLGIAVDFFLVSARRPFLISGLLSAAALAAAPIALVLGSALGALVLAACGFLGLLLSLVGEYCQRIYQLAQGLPFYELRDPAEPKGRSD